ncbi:DUF397 domain-containing protein [Streptomyces sp. LP11]|uniref:DUF397 domain-containing protein n=1 Tax=Streptomyces pyxinicus TaxID=2970331 RepID=A0ABT2B366_9ACTN|nr:DUF397 domain-containing protein [Streptomyces sp. LP11]MCS0602968.1 DUF397 domain-containing protein [Streptomyces sp. LP11]
MSTAELRWFKSSYSSSSEPGDCVETALAWFKSSYSDSSEPGDCLEVAPTPTTIHIRDSKDTASPCLTVTPTTWTAFLSYAAL